MRSFSMGCGAYSKSASCNGRGDGSGLDRRGVLRYAPCPRRGYRSARHGGSQAPLADMTADATAAAWADDQSSAGDLSGIRARRETVRVAGERQWARARRASGVEVVHGDCQQAHEVRSAVIC